RDRDPAFAAAMARALDRAIDLLEGEVFRRAHAGTEEPVFQGGKKVGQVRRYSDQLALALLRAHRPKYRETKKLEHSRPGGAPSRHADANPPDLSRLTVDELRQLRALRRRLDERAAAGQPGGD